MLSHVLLCHCESVHVCPSKLESLSHDRNLAVITSVLGWRPLFCAKTVVFQAVLGEVVFGIVKLASISLFTSKLVAFPAWSCDCTANQRPNWPNLYPPWPHHFKLEFSADLFCHKTWVQFMKPKTWQTFSSANRESGIISSQVGALTYGGWRYASTSVEEKMMEMLESFILVDTKLVKEKPYEGNLCFSTFNYTPGNSSISPHDCSWYPESLTQGSPWPLKKCQKAPYNLRIF